MQRVLKAEILDTLSPDDPAALHNRQDLRIINRLMGNYGWLRQTVSRLARADDRVLEIGAGTGELARSLAAHGITVDGLDLWPQPQVWTEDARWHQADLCTFDRWDEYSVIVGNLILHQFDAPTLHALGRRITPHVRALIFSEPARRVCWQWLFAGLCRLIGANHVSRHDGWVSIAAGFRGNELPALLGLDRETWRCDVSMTARGAYRMIAERVPGVRTP